jgi:hypothetical protein
MKRFLVRLTSIPAYKRELLTIHFSCCCHLCSTTNKKTFSPLIHHNAAHPLSCCLLLDWMIMFNSHEDYNNRSHTQIPSHSIPYLAQATQTIENTILLLLCENKSYNKRHSEKVLKKNFIESKNKIAFYRTKRGHQMDLSFIAWIIT